MSDTSKQMTAARWADRGGVNEAFRGRPAAVVAGCVGGNSGRDQPSPDRRSGELPLTSIVTRADIGNRDTVPRSARPERARAARGAGHHRNPGRGRRRGQPAGVEFLTCCRAGRS